MFDVYTFSTRTQIYTRIYASLITFLSLIAYQPLRVI